MLLPLPFQDPAVQAPAPPTYAEAEAAYLDAIDQGKVPKEDPALQGQERLAYRWLKAGAGWTAGPLPADPFRPGSPAHREAQALRHLLAGPLPAPAAVAKLPLSLGGSRVLLWRWLKAREVQGHLPPPLRRAVEDRLLEPGAPTLRGWALRHALCFSLAERDLDRFGKLRRTKGEGLQDLLKGFQSLFALLDGPTPAFRLWRLPELDYRDLGLGSLGAQRVWVAPLDLPPGKPGVAWILPSPSGELGDRESSLHGPALTEAQDLAVKFKAEGRSAWFAPSALEWEKQGLSFFPILLEMDEQGALKTIRMGDAAPARP